MTVSESLFQEALKYIPGGVNSPVRAFGAVNETPRFIEKADGAYIYDLDGNQYIDFVCSWGPMILGHNNPKILESVINACKKGLSFGAATENEVTMAKLICEIVPSVEMVRMVNSGTEAVMSAIRLSRGYTDRDKIIKFSGCYHGHSDSMLVKAGSGAMTSGIPDSAGVPQSCAQNTLTAVYNDLESVKTLFDRFGDEIAAVIVEPVAANMGVVLPVTGFLEGIRKLCTDNGALLIFDEVITGFRLGIKGAQGYFNIQPDLTTFGKIIGAGMPVGAYGGRKDIVQMVAPVGSVYQAGTLSGNPVAMAAGIAQLKILQSNPEIYDNLNKKADRFFEQISKILENNDIPCKVNHIGSLGCIFFTDRNIVDYNSARTSNTSAYADYFKSMLKSKIYLAPSQFEAMFLSAAHSDSDLDKTLDAIQNYFKNK